MCGVLCVLKVCGFANCSKVFLQSVFDPFFFFDKILRAMGNALFLVCNENPKVSEGLADLNKASKKTRDFTFLLIRTAPSPFHGKRLSN